ncbi:MAG: ABC transporter permease subunit [Blastocatellia bacterium]
MEDITNVQITESKDKASPIKEAFRVYGQVSRLVRSNLIIIWGLFFLGLWLLSVTLRNNMAATISSAELLDNWLYNLVRPFPSPYEVGAALYKMWSRQQLLSHVWATIKLNVVGLTYSTIISLVISYSSVIPIFQPFNKVVKLLRYIPFIGFTLIFFSLFTIGWPTKVAMLTTGMTFFLVTSMTDAVNAIPRMKYELAKVLGYNDWQIFYNVVVRPTLPQMIDMVAQNAAIGWIMITSIETYSRNEKGIGTQLYAYYSTNNLPEVYGLLIIIGIIALAEDGIFSLLKRYLFPYSVIAERG